MLGCPHCGSPVTGGSTSAFCSPCRQWVRPQRAVGEGVKRPPFDKKEYQRRYMRMWREKQKMTNHRLQSGVPGVSWCGRSNKWQAYAKVNGRRVYVGRHTSIKEAADAIAKAEADPSSVPAPRLIKTRKERGVTYESRRGLYRANVRMADGKVRSLSTHPTEELALAAVTKFYEETGLTP